MKKIVLAAAAATGILVAPAAAAADTKQVTVGPPKPLKVNGPAFDTDFYPRKVAIVKGDAVRFKWTQGFGDVAFVPKGEPTPPLASPDPDQPVAGATDAAGAAMWFNGQPNLTLNFPALVPSGGKKITGKRFVSSGFATEGPQKPWKVEFPKAGTYTMTSVLHPTLSMRVKVKASDRGVPSARQDARRVARQVKAVTKRARKLVRFEGPAGNVVRAGNDAGGTAQIAFFPARKTISVGESVRFAMPKDSVELHNVAFGPKDYLDEHMQRFFGPVVEPFVVYRSEAPGALLTHSAGVHGNGYVNTGLLDSVDDSPFPAGDTVTFSQPGTYTYYCAVHGNEMKGEIVVQ